MLLSATHCKCLMQLVPVLDACNPWRGQLPLMWGNCPVGLPHIGQPPLTHFNCPWCRLQTFDLHICCPFLVTAFATMIKQSLEWESMNWLFRSKCFCEMVFRKGKESLAVSIFWEMDQSWFAQVLVLGAAFWQWPSFPLQRTCKIPSLCEMILSSKLCKLGTRSHLSLLLLHHEGWHHCDDCSWQAPDHFSLLWCMTGQTWCWFWFTEVLKVDGVTKVFRWLLRAFRLCFCDGAIKDTTPSWMLPLRQITVLFWLQMASCCCFCAQHAEIMDHRPDQPPSVRSSKFLQNQFSKCERTNFRMFEK